MEKQAELTVPVAVSQSGKVGVPKSDMNVVRDRDGNTSFSGFISIGIDQSDYDKALKLAGTTFSALNQLLVGKYGNKGMLCLSVQGKTDSYIKFRPTNIQLAELITDPYQAVLGSATNKTQGPMKAHFSTHIQYTQSLTSSWSESNTVGKQISATVGFQAYFVSAELTVSVNSSTTVGKQESSTKTLSYGSEAGIQIDIPAGQSITVTVDASRGKGKIKVSYQASLQGDFVYVCQGQNGKNPVFFDNWKNYGIGIKNTQILEVSSVDRFNINVRNSK